ncbi:formylglycine-generating enzyme family protein [Breznakiellaceae bacterium SP9]
MKVFLIPAFTVLSAVAVFAQTANFTDFVLIKGGTFTMGSPASELDRIADETQHRVTITEFYLAKSEVTQKEYRDLMRNNPSNTQGDNLPVEQVTWFDAIRFCNERSAKGIRLQGGNNNTLPYRQYHQ